MGRLNPSDQADGRFHAVQDGNHPIRATDWTTMGVLALLFGSSFFLTAIASPTVGPLTIAAARLLVGSLVLNALLRIMANADGPRPAMIAVVALGLFNSLFPIGMIAWAQQSLPSSLTAILAATSPIFGTVFAHFANREPASVWRILSVVVAFIGVALVIDPGSTTFEGIGIAPLAVLMAAASSPAVGVYGARILMGGVTALRLATGQVTAAAWMACGLALIVERPWLRPFPPPTAIGALVVMGLLSTALAYFLFFRLLAKIGAANTLLVGFLVPISATLLGVALLGESLGVAQVAGFAMVLLALGLVSRRAKPAAVLPADPD